MRNYAGYNGSVTDPWAVVNLLEAEIRISWRFVCDQRRKLRRDPDDLMRHFNQKILKEGLQELRSLLSIRRAGIRRPQRARVA